jgi:hypothetical protein
MNVALRLSLVILAVLWSGCGHRGALPQNAQAARPPTATTSRALAATTPPPTPLPVPSLLDVFASAMRSFTYPPLCCKPGPNGTCSAWTRGPACPPQPTSVCCTTDAAGKCSAWSSIGCDEDPRPVVDCGGWSSRMGCH